MAKCEITGKRSLVGNKVSHAKNRSKTRQQPSIKSKRVWDDEKGAWVRLNISTRALRSLKKMSLSELRRKASNI